MYASSSNQGSRRVNADGTYNVYCFSCGEFVSTSVIQLGKVLCVICQAAEEGRELPEQLVREYMLSKGTRADVSGILLRETQDDPSLRPFTFRGMASDIARAVGKIVQQVKEIPKSATIARGKRRPRLFDNVQIGNIDEESKDGS
jgi:hypothetical protein